MDHFAFELPDLTSTPSGMVPLACAVLSEDLERLGAMVLLQ